MVINVFNVFCILFLLIYIFYTGASIFNFTIAAMCGSGGSSAATVVLGAGFCQA